MKKILVYYSLGGNTRAVAKKIASKLKIKTVELKTLKASTFCKALPKSRPKSA